MTEVLDQMGPIDYLVLEFPGSRLTGEALPLLVDLVERGVVRVLDLLFLKKDLDGSVTVLQGADAPNDEGLDLEIFDGASSGLLDSSDIQEVAEVLEPGNSAGVLVYENRWAAPFAAAVRRSGGQLVASGRIPFEDVVAALDALEPVAG